LDAVSATLRGIRSLIQSEVSAANSVVQTAVKGINKVTSVFVRRLSFVSRHKSF